MGKTFDKFDFFSLQYKISNKRMATDSIFGNDSKMYPINFQGFVVKTLQTNVRGLDM